MSEPSRRHRALAEFDPPLFANAGQGNSESLPILQ
jgi:hypothetical protein